MGGMSSTDYWNRC